MTRGNRLVSLMVTGAMGLAALGCTDGSGPSGNPRVTIRLTDAAGEVKAAVVTISEIFLEGGANGRVVLSSTPITTDLVALANATATLVDGASIQAGTYGELRFVITGAYVEVEGAGGQSQIYASSTDYAGLPAGATVTGTLQMPSLGSSGLKVQFANQTDLSISADQDLLVDFDVSQSFGHVAGASGNWVLHPVIKGATASAAATVTVALSLGSGVTLPTIGGSAVTLAGFTAKLGGETAVFTDADANGTFEATFRYLLPDTYSLSIEGPAGVTFTTNPALPVEVQANASATTTVSLTLASASAP